LSTCLEKKETVFIADASDSPWIDTTGLHVDLRSILVVPLVVLERTLGAIVLVNSEAESGLREADAEVLRTVANLCAAAVDNAMLYEQTRRTERISAEMKLASDIQNALLPGPYPAKPEFELHAWCMSASETGGDFYDFFDMGEDRTGIVIGDATGHGIGAALYVFIARATFKALLTRTHDPEDIVRTMNDLLEEDADDGRFLTFFFGVFDHRTRLLSFTSAGHDPPIIYRATKDDFVDKRSTGIPLGIFPGSPFPVAEVVLVPGDFLVFGTDGIWEAANPRNEQYGKGRLREAMRKHHARPLEEASEAIRREILDFHEGGPRRDDITAVCMRVK
jgi:sigma-B regulation protein RsbU (phosphoserine phosphatase)